MLKLSIIFCLLTSIVWRTAPTHCNQTLHNHDNNNNNTSHDFNANEKLAKNIYNYVDGKNWKPCESFYQYACGNWYQQFIDEFGFHNTLQMLDYKLNNQLEPLLSTESEFSSEQSTADIYAKVRIYYKSCRRVKPYNLKKYLQIVRPGSDEATWWVLSYNRPAGMRQWEPHNFDWLAAIAKLRLYGLNGVLLREQVLPRWDQSHNNSIYLDKPTSSQTQPIASGWTAWVEILLDIGQTKRVANDVARKVHTFEMQLHALQQVEDDEGMKEMRLSYLQQYLPQLDWMQYLEQLKQPHINQHMTIIIRNLPYMRALVKLLHGVQRETLCNYIMLKFIQYLKQRGPAEINKQECVASLRRAMPLALSHIVAHNLLDTREQDQGIILQQLFVHLKQKFGEILKSNRLQLPHTIVEMLVQKIVNMELQVGHAPHNMSVQFYHDYYEHINMDANNFYVNQLNLLRHAVQKSHESLLNNFTATEGLDGSSSSPYYVRAKNVLVVPHGFLQMPIYHRQLLHIYQYSVLGFALAHELMQGFDANGIDYDAVGNMMGPSEEIMLNTRFTQGLRCMQQSVASGSGGGGGKQEKRELNEKLADFEGLRLSYAAYFNSSQSNNFTVEYKKDPAVQSVLGNFTQEQVFFLNFAQLFCGKEYRNMQQKAMDELRVKQLFNNFDEFSNAFGCTRRLKNKTRCRLW